jgi:SAM-dependent methyltransferase
MNADERLTAEFIRAVELGERFEFGRNWTKFLKALNEERIAWAEKSLKNMLGTEDMRGRSFVDIGSGSGLFSLAARRLGARVHSFDYDPYSVASTAELRNRFFSADPDWKVEQGSVLDTKYLESLGQFDIVYCWGVLHHTGSMWQALGNVVPMTRAGSLLFIAIYNDQGKKSRRWLEVKKTYNALPPSLRFIVLWPVFWHMWWRRLLKDLLVGQPTRSFRRCPAGRGMSLWHDVVDWVGGYPFEVAKPEQIFDFYRERGFQLIRMMTQGSNLGCNEFVFQKE